MAKGHCMVCGQEPHAVVRRALAEADRLAEACEAFRALQERTGVDWTVRAGLRRKMYEAAAAYLAAREETR